MNVKTAVYIVIAIHFMLLGCRSNEEKPIAAKNSIDNNVNIEKPEQKNSESPFADSVIRDMKKLQFFIANDMIDTIKALYFMDSIQLLHTAVPGNKKSSMISKKDEQLFDSLILHPLKNNRFAQFRTESDFFVLSLFPNADSFPIQAISWQPQNINSYEIPLTKSDAIYGTGYGYSYYCRYQNGQLVIWKVLHAESA